ncbi:MAG TPA: hypothetical protein ENI87_00315 [bacterium]|nr:hypothetical protein [bacterium]
MGGIASNVSGTTDKVLTLTITGADKDFEVKVERKVVVNGQVLWEVIETVQFSSINHPPVVLPPGCRASIQDRDASDEVGGDVIGSANLA